MTQVRARRGDREGDPHSAPKRNPYLELLRAPGALAFSSAGFVGRMSMSMYGLGTVLLIALLTGRYGEAGAVAAARPRGDPGVRPPVPPPPRPRPPPPPAPPHPARFPPPQP